ncbi:LUD domain-containing protein [Actinophytocola sp.]|uniref:LUD domain-containing protein n=1 Tax=Actinophytocola sp. TaxID=1872138 RepID=UPI002D7FC22D|nr:LUD domain-containing protein [Actinophytocola sp.]HET9137937.1 LUD domain-containing protein [Actinophytocola sp.]
MTTQELIADQTFAVPARDEALRRAADALAERGIAAHVVDTVADARRLVRELLPRDKEIFTSLSETLRLSGITEDIDTSGEFRSVRTRLAEFDGDVRAQITMGAAPDVVVGSVHAITEDGVLLAASASGSQFASYAAGAERAIWVVGAQKVVPDFETALRRLRTYSLPREQERMAATGWQSFIGKILIIEREVFPDRGTVVLVREPIGF